MEILTKKAGIIAPPSKMDTIEIDLGTDDPSKMAIISAHISKELELAPTFSEKIRIYSHGSQMICQVFRVSWLSTN